MAPIWWSRNNNKARHINFRVQKDPCIEKYEGPDMPEPKRNKGQFGKQFRVHGSIAMVNPPIEVSGGPDPKSIKKEPIMHVGSALCFTHRKFYVATPGPPRSRYCDMIWAVGSARARSNDQDLML